MYLFSSLVFVTTPRVRENQKRVIKNASIDVKVDDGNPGQHSHPTGLGSIRW